MVTPSNCQANFLVQGFVEDLNIQPQPLTCPALGEKCYVETFAALILWTCHVLLPSDCQQWTASCVVSSNFIPPPLLPLSSNYVASHYDQFCCLASHKLMQGIRSEYNDGEGADKWIWAGDEGTTSPLPQPSSPLPCYPSRPLTRSLEPHHLLN